MISKEWKRIIKSELWFNNHYQPGGTRPNSKFISMHVPIYHQPNICQILNVEKAVENIDSMAKKKLFSRKYCAYTGWPRNNGTVDTVDFQGFALINN